MIRAVLFAYDAIFAPGGTQHSGAEAFLGACAGRFPLMLTARGAYADIKAELGSSGVLAPFLDIVTESEVEHPKPKPDLLLATLGRIGFLLRDRNPIEPRECLVIESSVDGVEASRRARMRCLAIAHTVAAAQLAKADFVRDSFAAIDLDEILRALK
jgi:beta-phosphoglucomutase-like phosphatase (HAD superfamily)